MRRRLIKEVRSLLLPAGLVLGATLLALSVTAFGLRSVWSLRLAAIGFFVGTPLLAAWSLGAEFQNRTIALLLAQPLSRTRIWIEKWLVLVAMVGALALIELAALKAGPFDSGSGARGSVFVLMVVCSAPLWTLVARSTIGGMAFSLSTIMMLELGYSYVAFKMTGTWLPGEVFAVTPALVAVRLAYSALTLWLGWRVFSRFQAAGSGFGGAASGADRAAIWRLLRSRPDGAIANLVRKEVSLQRPTFLVAALFSVCWLATTAFAYLEPSRQNDAAVIFAVLLFIHVPLVLLLAGAISIGEETTHGTREWHLTLPVSTRVQWAVKLAVSLVVALVLAIVLPSTLASLSGGAMPDSDFPVRLNFPVILVFLGAVILSFWASTLFGHTIRAAVATGVVLFALVWCIPVAGWTGQAVGLRARWLAEPLHLSQRLLNSNGAWILAIATILASVLVPALWQSLEAFRRPTLSTRTIARMLAALLAVAIVVMFCLGILGGSVGGMAFRVN